MFSIQRYIRKKENERRILEDKKKKLQSQEDDDRSKSTNKFPNERPQKKIHKQWSSCFIPKMQHNDEYDREWRVGYWW